MSGWKEKEEVAAGSTATVCNPNPLQQAFHPHDISRLPTTSSMARISKGSSRVLRNPAAWTPALSASTIYLCL